jgi:hypothetical protein
MQAVADSALYLQLQELIDQIPDTIVVRVMQPETLFVAQGKPSLWITIPVIGTLLTLIAYIVFSTWSSRIAGRNARAAEISAVAAQKSSEISAQIFNDRYVPNLYIGLKEGLRGGKQVLEVTVMCRNRDVRVRVGIALDEDNIIWPPVKNMPELALVQGKGQMTWFELDKVLAQLKYSNTNTVWGAVKAGDDTRLSQNSLTYGDSL